ncbi:MAG: winged helix DNA-binding domain-containing protein [Desulfosporosinus sp.]|nr:winged helix DNA-binding domain-containing protein [Desulfosporosinus sp.]
MDWEKINCYVLEKQHLINKCNNIVKCVEDIAGLNSITATTPYLSLFNRIKDFKKSMLDEEMYEKKRLYRLRLMRSALFIVTRDFLPIAYSATIDRTQKRLAGRWKGYNLSEKEFEELKDEIIAVLGEGEKTAVEIRKELGTNVSISLILRLLMEDVPLLRGRPLGTWKGEQFRYSLLSQNIKLRMNKEKAKILLVEKFLQSFGPATLKDIAWWSGFSQKESKKILEEIKIIDIGDGLLLLEREAEDFENFKVGEESLLLMSGYDQYVITYKYSMYPRFVNQEYLKKIYDEYGELHNPIIRNGRIIGRWYIKEGEIGYLLYKKIGNKTKLNQEIREMEGFHGI